MVLIKKVFQGMLIIVYILSLKVTFFSGRVDPPPLIGEKSSEQTSFLRPP